MINREDFIKFAQFLDRDVNWFGKDYIQAETDKYLTENPHLLDQYPDTEADGIVFCGKCGKMR